MTSQIVSLLKYDLISLKNWYSTKVVVKLLVTVLFFGIFVFLFSLIYIYCFVFFQTLRQYDSYGQFVARYLMVSSVIFLLVFTTLATTLSALLASYSQTQSFKKILIFPISNLVLSVYYSVRFFGASLVSALILILPIFASYARVYHFNLAVSLVLTVSLTIIVHSLGLSISSLLLRLFSRFRSLSFVSFLVLVYLAFVSTSNLILPQNFSLLYQSPAETFFILTNTLPVTKSLIYQYLLDPGQPLISTLIIVTFSLCFAILNLILQSLFLRYNMVVTNSLNIKPSYFPYSFIATRLPITKKDLLYLQRKPQEVINVFFFLIGGIVITLLTQNLKYIRPFTGQEANSIGLFAFGWYSFFAISYCLRFILPLLSIEGQSLGLLLVYGRRKLFSQKLISTVVLTIPLLFSSLLLWYFFKLPIDKISYILASFKIILFASLLSFFQGWLNPDFKDSASPDKVSTSLSGLLVLVFCLVYLFTQYLYLSQNALWHPAFEIVPITLLLLLGYIAKNKTITLSL